ncbi:unnamed protein product [Schistocephalus solidus]|uniref:Integrase catalytic domain-containing protein n=1 Tax=Schistocephalus solidus TaxID=70667 RepID=A0A183SAI1_SCHSO|nr:unnamed protein product [Schistocephalus solidus]
MTTSFHRERVGLDIIGPLPISFHRHEYILMMIDYFTKWTKAIPLLHQDAASVANAINRRDLRLPVDLHYPLPSPEQTTPQTFATKLHELPPTQRHPRRIIPFTAHFSKLKPYRGRLPVCTADSLPILPADQVPQ